MSASASDNGTFHEQDRDSDSDWQEIGSAQSGTDLDLDDVDSDLSDTDSAGLDRWEGIIESGRADSPFITPQSFSGPSPSSANVSIPTQLSASRQPVLSPLARNVLATEEDLIEDARVQNGLEQSVVSTLSASRSSGSSSRAELRLSFPDPLTKSGEIVPLAATITKGVMDERGSAQSPVTSGVSGTDTSQAEGILTTLEKMAMNNTTSPAVPFVLAHSPQPIDESSTADNSPAHDIFVGLETIGSPELDSLAASLVTPEGLEGPASPAPSANLKAAATELGERPATHNVRRLLDQMRGYHFPTILAILSFAIGYMVSMSNPGMRPMDVTFVKPSAPKAAAVVDSKPMADNSFTTTQTWSLEDSNVSSASAMENVTVEAVITVTPPAALAVIANQETSVSIQVLASAEVAAASRSSDDCPYVSRSPKRANAEAGPSKALITAPPSSLSVRPSPPTSLVPYAETETWSLPRAHHDYKGKQKEQNTISILEPALIALHNLAKGVVNDLSEVLRALDELASAVASALRAGKSAVRDKFDSLREASADRFSSRHARAKVNAAKLGTRAKKVIGNVEATVRWRHKRAKVNARKIGDAVGEWLGGVKDVVRKKSHGAKVGAKKVKRVGTKKARRVARNVARAAGRQ